MTALNGTTQDDALGALLEEHRLEAGVPGAAVALWAEGSVRAAASGKANVEADIDADLGTIFQIGSITKVFTATLLLALADAGRIDIASPVTRYLPGFRVARRAAPPELTVRSLLDHTSGIAGDFFADFGPGPESLARYVDACADLPLLFPPGAMRGYNSTAYCVAGRVAEVVTGLGFEAALEQFLLRPLGLARHAFYHCDVARFRTAVGHVVGPDGVRTAARLRLPECMSPAGASLTMSAVDLLRFGLLHLRGGVTEKGERLLSVGSAASMSAPVASTGSDVGTELLLGWAALQTDRGRLIAASGATIEQNAFLGILPDAGMVLAILANTGGGAQRLALSIGANLFRQHAGAAVNWPSPPAWPRERPRFDAARYIGEYTNHTRLSVSDADGGLFAVLSAWDAESDQVVEQPFVLDPLGDDRFGPRAPGSDGPAAVFRFVFRDGAARAGHVVQAGRVFARCDAQGRTDVGMA